MKKLVLLLVVVLTALLMFTSCTKQICPAYSQEQTQKEVNG